MGEGGGTLETPVAARPTSGGSQKISEAQSWRKRNMTHQCSHERAPASAHASAHASVHESAHKSWISRCYIRKVWVSIKFLSAKFGFPPSPPPKRAQNEVKLYKTVGNLECSRECSRGCPRKCTRNGLVVCHLVCFHLLCSLPTKVEPPFGNHHWSESC